SPPVHDPCAVARVIDPSVMECLEAFVAIETRGEFSSGMTVTDFSGRLGRPNVKVATRLNVDRFWDLMVAAIERIGAAGDRASWVVASRALVLMLALVLAACGGPSGAQATAQTHVCIATNSEGSAPHTFNQLAADGARGVGAGVQVIVSKPASDYLSSLHRCVAAKPDLVIGVSPDMASAVWRAAQLHADHKFALVDGTPLDDNGQEATLTNVTDVLFKQQEPAYLVGAMAGLMEKQKIGSASHNVLGVLGSNHGPAVGPYIAGFVAGARDADPSVIIKIAYSDSQDTAFCKQLGIAQISGGADILFEV